MGAKNSKLGTASTGEAGGRGGSGCGSPTGQPGDSNPASSNSSRPSAPLIDAPYSGPWAEYQFVDVTVPVEADVAFSFCDVTMASTNSSRVLASLAAAYSQGYSLMTFCRVPGGGGGGVGGAGGGGGGGGSHRRVFSPGREVHYQGIFCRYEGDPGNEGWNLRVEKSLLQANHVTPGVVATETGPGAQHVQQLISSTVQTGGRLLTVQWSGQPQQTSAETALGVDVFFEVPDVPLPERSVYQLVTAPATVLRRTLFASKSHVTCDWAAILTRHLARGWRLVDIFCEAPAAAGGGGVSLSLSPSSVKIQTVWFFEKPESRARDESPVYEGTIVEHWIDVVASSSCSPSSFVSGTAAGCLGGGRAAAHSKKGGGGGSGSGKGGGVGVNFSLGKKNSKRLASLKKKGDEEAAAASSAGEAKAKSSGGNNNESGDVGSPKEDTTTASAKDNDRSHLEVTTTSAGDRASLPNDPHASQQPDKNHFSSSSGDHRQCHDHRSHNNPSSSSAQSSPQDGEQGGQQQDVAGWESMIRSMGEKGWELATVVNSMDSQVVGGRPRVKVLLVFQRRISLAMTVKGRRTSDGLALRADTGASTSVMCDIPMMMSGETVSHLNPSLAVRLPLSRSASREHEDFQSAACDDDIPSTIGGGGGVGSRSQSATDLSMTGRVIESTFLEPGGGRSSSTRRGVSRGGGGGGGEGGSGAGLFLPKGSVDDGSIGTGERSSHGSQHSRVTAVEIHTPCSGEALSTSTASEGKDVADKELSGAKDADREHQPTTTTTTASTTTSGATGARSAPKNRTQHDDGGSSDADDGAPPTEVATTTPTANTSTALENPLPAAVASGQEADG